MKPNFISLFFSSFIISIPVFLLIFFPNIYLKILVGVYVLYINYFLVKYAWDLDEIEKNNPDEYDNKYELDEGEL